MSCPKCPEDFKVKNLPNEIECLVANKIANTPEIRDPSGNIDLSERDIVLTGDIPVGKNDSGVPLLTSELIDGSTNVYKGNSSPYTQLTKGEIFQDASGQIWVALNQ